MARVRGRQRRGRESELLLAEWLRRSGWPYAVATPGSAAGRDLANTQPFSIEVKAHANLSIPAFVRQAVKNTDAGEIPVLVLRLNGQGARSIEDWPIVLPSLSYLRPLMSGFLSDDL